MGLRRLFWFALLICPLAVWAQQTNQPLSIDDVLDVRTFPGLVKISISPDGKYVAYTLQDERRRESAKRKGKLGFSPSGAPFDLYGCDVWVTNVATGKSQNLTLGRGTSWAPVWSPDGRYLAFNSDRSGQANAWIWERSTGRLRRASQAILHFAENQETLVWTRDSRRLIAKILPAGSPLPSRRSQVDVRPADDNKSTVVLFSSDESATPADSQSVSLGAYGQSLTADLALLDPQTGAAEIIARQVTTQWYAASPDGENIAFTWMKRYEAPNTYQRLWDLLVYNEKNHKTTVVASNIQQVLDPFVSWSPDGTSLSYVTYGPKARGECVVVSSTGVRRFSSDVSSHPPFGSLMTAPIWSPDAKLIYFFTSNALWSVSGIDGCASKTIDLGDVEFIESVLREQSPWSSPNDSTMIFLGRNKRSNRERLHQLDVKSGDLSELADRERSYGRHPVFAFAKEAEIVCALEDAQHSMDLWSVNTTTNLRQQITDTNPQFAKHALGGTELVVWKSTDGNDIKGALLLPAGFVRGKKYPLVVEVYGGAYLSTRLNQFGVWGNGSRNLQLLATRGYAVLLPDIPMRVGQPMKDIANAVLPGIDRVIEMGIADPDRIGVMGESYGGYSVLALIVQSQRFKAAIDYAGYGNVISQYLVMNQDGSRSFALAWNEEGRGGLGGTLWQQQERYIDNSPLFQLNRVMTPLLIVHGGEDWPHLADEIFVALRRLNKKVVYARYEGEGHGLTKLANQKDHLNRMLDWFDKYLEPGK